MIKTENKTIIPERELDLINNFARKKLDSEEIYTFSLILCDNEIDRDTEKFTVKALNELAPMFVGKTGIFDHNMSGKGQTARIYETEVVTDQTRKTADGEDYTCIKAKAYMVRTEKNKDLIAEIEAGIKKETSVGCSVQNIACSICGKNIKTEGCEHRKGKTYGGKLCCHQLSEPSDAYEWSFVAVPAQKFAGVTKSFRHSETHDDTGNKAYGDVHGEMPDGARENEDMAAWGYEYKNELKAEIIKDAAAVLPELDGKSLDTICERLSVGELRELKQAFKSKAAQNLPILRQLEVKNEKDVHMNSEYKI